MRHELDVPLPASENRTRYDDLEAVTLSTLSALNVEDFINHSSPQVRYIGERTRVLRAQFDGAMLPATDLEQIGVIVALRRLISRSDCILQGTLTGAECISATPGLWQRMMCDWPMGEYGRVLAEYINAEGLANGKILELGAGVGHASRYVQTDPQLLYVKTDRDMAILRMYNKGVLRTYDIDSDDVPFENFNLVFASNVLHCAADKKRTLKNILRMLAPGGHLVFSEGAPEVRPSHEWCLAPLFGFFDGWWDRGGFIDAKHWSALVKAAGFSMIAVNPMYCGRNTLGYLATCRKDRWS